MLKLLNLNEHEKEILFALKLRRYTLYTAYKAPQNLKYYCIAYQNNDFDILNRLNLEIMYDEKIQNYLNHNEKIWLYYHLEMGSKFNKIFYSLFPPDRIYRNNTKRISEYMEYYSLEFIYYAINYIDDNFPVIRNKALSKNEICLINFFLLCGTEEEYMKKYSVSDRVLKNIFKIFAIIMVVMI